MEAAVIPQPAERLEPSFRTARKDDDEPAADESEAMAAFDHGEFDAEYSKYHDSTACGSDAEYEDDCAFDVFVAPVAGLESRLKKSFVKDPGAGKRRLVWSEHVEDNEDKITRIGQMMRRQRALLRLQRTRIQRDVARWRPGTDGISQTTGMIRRQMLDADAVFDSERYSAFYKLRFMLQLTPETWTRRCLKRWQLDVEELCKLEPNFDEYLGKLSYVLSYCPDVVVTEDMIENDESDYLILISTSIRIPPEAWAAMTSDEEPHAAVNNGADGGESESESDSAPDEPYEVSPRRNRLKTSMEESNNSFELKSSSSNENDCSTSAGTVFHLATTSAEVSWGCVDENDSSSESSSPPPASSPASSPPQPPSPSDLSSSTEPRMVNRRQAVTLDQPLELKLVEPHLHIEANVDGSSALCEIDKHHCSPPATPQPENFYTAAGIRDAINMMAAVRHHNPDHDLILPLLDRVQPVVEYLLSLNTTDASSSFNKEIR